MKAFVRDVLMGLVGRTVWSITADGTGKVTIEYETQGGTVSRLVVNENTGQIEK